MLVLVLVLVLGLGLGLVLVLLLLLVPASRSTSTASVEGLAVQYLRAARAAARAASDRLGDPALAKAYELQHLYAGESGRGGTPPTEPPATPPTTPPTR